MKLRKSMKPSKTDQSGGKKPAKTFLKGDGPNALSLAAEICRIYSLQQKPKDGEEENTPEFTGTEGKEISLFESRRTLNKNL